MDTIVFANKCVESQCIYEDNKEKCFQRLHQYPVMRISDKQIRLQMQVQNEIHTYTRWQKNKPHEKQ
jgi:hypothetical protein